MNIGEFARLGGVSIRMLRRYDDLDLLKPERVDPISGYRQYSAGQLTVLQRLQALRDVGFTLRESRHLLTDEPDLASALRARHAAIEPPPKAGPGQDGKSGGA